jgi:hypothetical protein
MIILLIGRRAKLLAKNPIFKRQNNFDDSGTTMALQMLALVILLGSCGKEIRDAQIKGTVMREKINEDLGGPDGTVEGTACFLMTFLDPAKPDECHATVQLMTKLIPIFCDSYANRQHDPPK